MRWDSDKRRRKLLDFYSRRSFEHRWFAWRPVKTVEGMTVWLECVWRKWLPHMARWSYRISILEYQEGK